MKRLLAMSRMLIAWLFVLLASSADAAAFLAIHGNNLIATWDSNPSEEEVTHYNLQWEYNSVLGEVAVINETGSGLSSALYNPAHGQYRVRVTAVNEIGESDPSWSEAVDY